VFTKQPSRDRHNREYTAWEVRELLTACGYEVTTLQTHDVYDDQNPKWRFVSRILWFSSFLSLGLVKWNNRGDTIFVLARKLSTVVNRYPSFLYA